MNTKEKIINELKTVCKERKGINNLINYIENACDFFQAPSSTIYHNNEVGGLAEHSWSVYNILKKKVEEYGLKTPPDSVAICGLCHDFCKINFYELQKKWKKLSEDVIENGRLVSKGPWGQEEIWVTNDTFPVGHGEKSVIILQQFISLTPEEIIAIRWHMAGFEPSVHFNYPSGYPFREATKKYPLLTAIICADMESSNIIENTNYDPVQKRIIEK